MNAALPAITGLVVGVVTALGLYLAAARRMSGNIATSEAGTLWAASESMRKDQGERLKRLEDRVYELEKRNNELADENLRLMRETLDLQTENRQLRDERDELRAGVEALEAKLRGRRRDDQRS